MYITIDHMGHFSPTLLINLKSLSLHGIHFVILVVAAFFMLMLLEASRY